MKTFHFKKVMLSGLLALHACSDASPPPREVAGGSSGANGNKCLSLTSISWTSTIGPLFTAKCGSCHNGLSLKNYADYSTVVANISSVKTRVDNKTMPSGGLPAADITNFDAWVTAGTPQNDSASTGGSTTASSSTGSSGPASSGTTGSTKPSAGGDCVPSNSSNGIPQQQTSSTGNATTASTGNTTPTTTTGSTGSTTGIPPVALVPTYSGGVKTIMDSYCVTCHYGGVGAKSPNLSTAALVKTKFTTVMSEINSKKMPPSGPLPQAQIDLLKSWGTAPNKPYGQWAN